MNKSKLFAQFKELYGGEYYRKDGRNFWRKTPNDQGVIVSSGFIINMINNYKPETAVPEVTPEPTPVAPSLPKPVKKSAPKKKTTTEEATNSNESV